MQLTDCFIGGITISPVISKLFESILLHLYDSFLTSRAFQFGQKKFRFDSRYRIDFFNSIRQSDKFAACTLIFI